MLQNCGETLREFEIEMLLSMEGELQCQSFYLCAILDRIRLDINSEVTASKGFSFLSVVHPKLLNNVMTLSVRLEKVFNESFEDLIFLETNLISYMRREHPQRNSFRLKLKKV